MSIHTIKIAQLPIENSGNVNFQNLYTQFDVSELVPRTKIFK